MEKEEVYKKLEGLEEFSIVNLKWDRGNGPLERLVSFRGFDKKGPKLYVTNETRIDIDLIGGYGRIISLEHECPDGHLPQKS